MAPVFGYWAIRGLAQPVRYTLLQAGVEFEDKHYNSGAGPEFNRSEWTSVKETLGLEFPNLPYYIDGDVKITESSAIAKYVARKHDLVGSTDAEIIRIDMAEGILNDVARSIIMLSYDPAFESKKGAFIDNSGPTVAKLSKLVGTNDYIAGSKLTWIDFVLVELLERFVALIPNSLDSHPNLQAYEKRILELPKIKKYRDSSAFQKIKNRFNGPMAKFGAGV